MVPFRHASLDVRFAQNPGRAYTSLRRRQLFQPNQPQNSGRCDAECGGAFTDGHLAAGLPLSLTVDRNRMVVAQRADTLRSPDLSVCRAALIPIQDRGDPRVWFDPRQHANDLHEIIVGDIPMPATAPALIVVGSMMVSVVGEIAWQDPEVAIPAFLTMMTIPLTFSIANGLAFGFTAYSLLKILRGKFREVNWFVYLLTALFILRFLYVAHG